jgi:hypothetical protein
MTARDPIIGIDLGTTFSLAAYADASGPHIIRDSAGEGRVPSVITVQPAAEPDAPPAITLGWEARQHAIENATSTVYSVKRLIGKGLDDVRTELPFLAYHVAGGPRDTVQVEIGGRLYTPEEISSVILRALKERAERHFNRPVTRAVITVPAYFDDTQRQATRDAARAAGLEVLRIINEPTAAALAYGIGAREKHAPRAGTAPTSLPMARCSDGGAPTEQAGQQTVAVYDLGGGTFDVSILRLEGRRLPGAQHGRRHAPRRRRRRPHDHHSSSPTKSPSSSTSPSPPLPPSRPCAARRSRQDPPGRSSHAPRSSWISARTAGIAAPSRATNSSSASRHWSTARSPAASRPSTTRASRRTSCSQVILVGGSTRDAARPRARRRRTSASRRTPR